MSNKEKILLTFTFFSWISIFILILCLEVFEVLIGDILVLLVIFGLTSLASIGYLIYNYYANRNKIKADRQKYLNSLKPKTPLRYCPSDDELLNKYKAGVIKDKDLEILKVEPSKIVKWQELNIEKQEHKHEEIKQNETERASIAEDGEELSL